MVEQLSWFWGYLAFTRRGMSSIELESSGINNFYIYSPLFDEEDGSCGPLCAVDKLVEKCAQNKIVLFYLRSIGNYWPMDESWCSFDKIYFGLSRLINVASVFNWYFGSHSRSTTMQAAALT